MDPVLPIFWNLPAPQVLEQLSSAPQGLSATQAETALARFGPNELRPTDRLSGLRLLLKQFASPITLILIAGAILSLFLGDVADATIILIIVVVSGVLGFWQEHGAANTVAKLLAVVQTKATVLRDGNEVKLALADVVPGDLVLLAAGATIPGDCLLIFAKLYHLPHAEREQRVREALAFMGLTDAAEKLVRTYSGGMIRRLEIAQSTLHRPRVLFLDEPTVGLDPLARSAVWEHLLRLRNVYGTTIFLTTHAMDEADQLCDRVAIMHQGRVAVVGAPAELKASIGGPGHTLDEVFKHYAGDALETGGYYRDTASERRTARRLG